jgi:recombinational DNA repair protein (RecF pathway)
MTDYDSWKLDNGYFEEEPRCAICGDILNDSNYYEKEEDICIHCAADIHINTKEKY